MITNEWPKITVNTTLDELKEIHKRIWDYVIEYGRKPSTPYFSDCVCCEYDNLQVIEHHHSFSDCHYCPLGKGFCNSVGLYRKWVSVEKSDSIEAKHLATLIRDAPFALPD